MRFPVPFVLGLMEMHCGGWYNSISAWKGGNRYRCQVLF